MDTPHYHNLDVAKIFDLLKSSYIGISSKEIADRHKLFGFNKIPKGKSFSIIRGLLEQFKNPLVYILIVAMVISFITGHHTDAWIILFVTLVSTIVGFLQEYKANNALSQLRSLITYNAKVIRDGVDHIIPESEVVPGDIIILNPGDKIPADARLIQVNNFEVIEAALTGESLPIKKHIDSIDVDTTIGDRKNMVFLGTVVSRGSAKAIVTGIGSDTEIGHIAKLVHEVEEGTTPLQKQITQFGKMIGIILIILNTIVFALGIAMGKPRLDMFLTSVSMVVAAVPEGLLPAMTIILAIGMQKLAKRNGLVRKMLATETLGAVSVICSDKTGTLTEGEMRVVDIVTETDPDKILKIALLCNDALIETNKQGLDLRISGNPTERALGLAAYEQKIYKKELEQEEPRIDEIAFESAHKYMVTKHQDKDGNFISYLKGAPEKILPFMDSIDIKGKIEKLSQRKREILESDYQELSATGLRVLAIAYKQEKNGSKLNQNQLQGYVFAGFVALKDPLRKDVRVAITLCQNAGMILKVITGDHKLTTMSIVNDLGIETNEDNVIEGHQIDKLSDKELQKIVRNMIIFARVEPKHKIRIVSALQAHGHIVAMTGDGVNDAPALKKADIGIAVGSGTDVAKETADLVLLDNNFHTIVEAVKRGRGTFDNIRKVILYLLSNSFKEVFLISLSLIAGTPLALLPVQILWIKMIEDSLPSIALAFDPVSKNAMNKPPRAANESILNKPIKKLLLFVVLICDIALFLIFYFFWKSSGDVIYAQTIAFVGLGIASRFYIFSIRNLGQSIFSNKLFDNTLVNLSTLFGFLMIILAVYIPLFNKVLHTTPLGIKEWIVLLAYGLFSLIVYEIGKKLFIPRENKSDHTEPQIK